MRYVFYDPLRLGVYFYPYGVSIAELEAKVGASSCNMALTFWLGAEALGKGE